MKKQNWLLHSLLFLFLNLTILNAGTIRGEIKDEKGNILSGVNIVLQDINIGTTSNQFGIYLIDNLPSGTYPLVFNYVGFTTVNIQVELENDQTIFQDIVMAERS